MKTSEENIKKGFPAYY